MEWFYNDNEKVIFNERYLYKLSLLGIVLKLPNKDREVKSDDVRCNTDDVVGKLEEYYTPFIDNLIEKAESELVKLQNVKLKTLLKLKKGDTDGY